MRRSVWVIAIFALAMVASSARAEAITLREIVELTRAGLGDEVLLALIEVDQRVFAIDPDTLKSLKDAGVSPAVIVAIVKSGRMPQLQPDPVVEVPPPDPPQPQVIVVDRPVVHEVAVPVPVYVAVGGRSYARHRQQPYVVPPTPFAPFAIPVVPTAVERPEPRKRPEPVYWGWGGKLRPDAWQPK